MAAVVLLVCAEEDVPLGAVDVLPDGSVVPVGSLDAVVPPTSVVSDVSVEPVGSVMSVEPVVSVPSVESVVLVLLLGLKILPPVGGVPVEGVCGLVVVVVVGAVVGEVPWVRLV